MLDIHRITDNIVIVPGGAMVETGQVAHTVTRDHVAKLINNNNVGLNKN